MTNRTLSTPAPPLVIYDGDCGFCMRSLSWLYAVARPPVPAWTFQGLDLARYGVTADRAAHEMLWVGASGQVVGGVRAFAALLRTCQRRWRVVGTLLGTVPVRWLAHLVYRLIANNRHRLPGGSDSCRISPL